MTEFIFTGQKYATHSKLITYTVDTSRTEIEELIEDFKKGNPELSEGADFEYVPATLTIKFK